MIAAPRVKMGLRWPADMPTVVKTRSPKARPCASAVTSSRDDESFSPSIPAVTITSPAVKNVRRRVPKNPAESARRTATDRISVRNSVAGDGILKTRNPSDVALLIGDLQSLVVWTRVPDGEASTKRAAGRFTPVRTVPGSRPPTERSAQEPPGQRSRVLALAEQDLAVDDRRRDPAGALHE